MKNLPLWQDINVYSVNTEERSGAGFPLNPANGEKKVMCLNGTWKFRFLPHSESVIEGYQYPDFNASDFDDLTVPSEWQIKAWRSIRCAKPIPISLCLRRSVKSVGWESLLRRKRWIW